MPKPKFKHALVQGLADLIGGGELFGGAGKVDLMTRVMIGSITPLLPSMLSSLDDNPEAVAMIRAQLREILAKDAEQFPSEGRVEINTPISPDISPDIYLTVPDKLFTEPNSEAGVEDSVNG